MVVISSFRSLSWPFLHFLTVTCRLVKGTSGMTSLEWRVLRLESTEWEGGCVTNSAVSVFSSCFVGGILLASGDGEAVAL